MAEISDETVFDGDAAQISTNFGVRRYYKEDIERIVALKREQTAAELQAEISQMQAKNEALKRQFS